MCFTFYLGIPKGISIMGNQNAPYKVKRTLFWSSTQSMSLDEQLRKPLHVIEIEHKSTGSDNENEIRRLKRYLDRRVNELDYRWAAF